MILFQISISTILSRGYLPETDVHLHILFCKFYFFFSLNSLLDVTQEKIKIIYLTRVKLRKNLLFFYHQKKSPHFYVIYKIRWQSCMQEKGTKKERKKAGRKYTIKKKALELIWLKDMIKRVTSRKQKLFTNAEAK